MAAREKGRGGEREQKKEENVEREPFSGGSLQEQAEKSDQRETTSYGTLSGAFVLTLLTIPGVIRFPRIGWFFTHTIAIPLVFYFGYLFGKP